jgi:putative oxidoreductase
MLKRILSTRDDAAALTARLVLGLVIFPHGVQKVLGWFGGYGLRGTMGYFTGTLGIPAALAALAIAAEFLGSIGLFTGLLTRVAAFGVATTMTVAVFMVHLQNGFFMNWSGQQKGEGFEYHILAIGLAVVIMIRGGGLLSLDRAVERRLP